MVRLYGFSWPQTRFIGWHKWQDIITSMVGHYYLHNSPWQVERTTYLDHPAVTWGRKTTGKAIINSISLHMFSMVEINIVINSGNLLIHPWPSELTKGDLIQHGLSNAINHRLTHKQLEMHGCIISTVTPAGMVQKHQAISIHSAKCLLYWASSSLIQKYYIHS